MYRSKFSFSILVVAIIYLFQFPSAVLGENYVLVHNFGSFGFGDGQFNYPDGIAIDSSGNVYVADTVNERIQQFTSDGIFITKFGSYGSIDGHFHYPSGIAIDNLGNIYVADKNNHRIQKFKSDGTFLSKWGTEGTSDGMFKFPSSVAVDSSGNIYVADTGNSRIQKFTSNEIFITKWGIAGYLNGDEYSGGDGELYLPRGIAVDNFDNVYVADTDNHRIQKFTSNGIFIKRWGGGWGGFYPSSDDGNFNRPCGVAVDNSGNVYVADTANGRIQKFNSNGGFITKWGSYGSENGQFVFPSAVASDNNGNVYVADTNNNRIQVFSNLEPTLINLSSFTASTKFRNVVIAWETTTELDNLGFNILRSESESGNYTKINRKLLKAKGTSTKGASYKFKDKNIEEGKTYWYKLEDIDSNTGPTQHDAVKVDVTAKKVKTKK